jgi:hypothetical protein
MGRISAAKPLPRFIGGGHGFTKPDATARQGSVR